MKKILYASVTAVTLALNINAAEGSSLNGRSFGSFSTRDIAVTEDETRYCPSFPLGEFSYEDYPPLLQPIYEMPDIEPVDLSPFLPPLSPLLTSETDCDNVHSQNLAKRNLSDERLNAAENTPLQKGSTLTVNTADSYASLQFFPIEKSPSASFSVSSSERHMSSQTSVVSNGHSESKSADTYQRTSSSMSDSSDDSLIEEPVAKRTRTTNKALLYETQSNQSYVIKWWAGLALSTRKGLLDYKDDKHAWRIFNKTPDVWERLKQDHQEEIVQKLIRPLDSFDTENLLVKHPRILPELCKIGSKETRSAIITSIANYESQLDKKGQKIPLKIHIPSIAHSKHSESVERIKAIVEEDGVVGDIPTPVQPKKRKKPIRVGIIPADGVDMRFRIDDWSALGSRKNLLLTGRNILKLQDIRQRLQLMGSIAFKAFQYRQKTGTYAFEWLNQIESSDRYNLLVLHPKTLVKLDELDESIREEVIKQMTAFASKSDAEKKAGFKIEKLTFAALSASEDQLITDIEAIVNKDYRGYFDPNPRHRKLPKGY